MWNVTRNPPRAVVSRPSKTAVMKADGRKEYTIIWFIENYSYCWHKNGEELVSPKFTADGLEDTVWTLGLFPRGNGEANEGYISLFLNRAGMDEGPEEFPLEYELSLRSTSRSTLVYEKFEYRFKRQFGYGNFAFIEMNKVLLYKDHYLPRDTLTVRCTMWKGEGKIQPKAYISARTRIGIEKFSFPFVVKDFSSLGSNKKTVLIKSPTNMKPALSSSLYINDSSGCDGKIIMEITPGNSYQTLSNFKISLLDASEKVTLLCEADNRFCATKKNIQKLPMSLPNYAIRGYNSVNDELSLLCECTFSTGVEFQKIENTVLELSSKLSSKLRIEKARNKDQDGSTELLSSCSSALEDLTNLYNNQLLSDIKIKTQTESFPTHKIVLCARSPVFQAMLTNDMREKNTDSIVIEDLENAMEQFLQFLYSDKIENLHWESAIKLYYAGDKYDIQKLKVMCASFLVKHLSESNAGDLLLLADTHSDSIFKKSVEDFIFKNEEKVFGSQQWRSLMKTNPELVSETMCRKYV